MTTIRLDPATLAKFRSAEGRVILADESGTPVRVCVLPAVTIGEPNLPPEEWERRAREPGGKPLAEVMEHLRGLDAR